MPELNQAWRRHSLLALQRRLTAHHIPDAVRCQPRCRCQVFPNPTVDRRHTVAGLPLVVVPWTLRGTATQVCSPSRHLPNAAGAGADTIRLRLGTANQDVGNSSIISSPHGCDGVTRRKRRQPGCLMSRRWYLRRGVTSVARHRHLGRRDGVTHSGIGDKHGRRPVTGRLPREVEGVNPAVPCFPPPTYHTPVA